MSALVGVRESAEAVGVDYQTFLGWIRQGLVRGVRLGARWRVPREELERVLREGTAPPPGKAVATS